MAMTLIQDIVSLPHLTCLSLASTRHYTTLQLLTDITFQPKKKSVAIYLPDL